MCACLSEILARMEINKGQRRDRLEEKERQKESWAVRKARKKEVRK